MAERLLMIRHGESETRYRGRYIGKTDALLSDEGQRQASALAAPLASIKDVSFFTSPLKRACQTAELALGRDTTIEMDDDLREIDFGLWEGLNFAEISAAYPAEVVQWAEPGEDFIFPRGESTSHFRRRIEAAANRIISNPAETVAVFSHGGVIRFLICHFLALSSSDHLSFDISPASISEIALFDGRGVLTRLNDRHHLEKPGLHTELTNG